jgi:hypothetical protein
VLGNRSFPRAALPLRLSLLVLGVCPASAAGAAPAARIRYQAPAECPGASTFLALLEDRTAGAWKLSMREGDPDIIVEIRDGPGRKVGRVSRPGRSTEGIREIAAVDCRDLVSALALSTALSLDDTAQAPAAIATAAPAATGPVAAVRADWIVGGSVETTFLISSEPMPEASLFLENGRRAWPLGPALGRPDVRLTLAYARNDLFAGERASFTLSSAELTVCPASIGFAATAGLRLCAAGDLGLLSGQGVSVTTPETSRFVWAAAGALARLRWAPGRRMVLEAQAGVVAPFERTTFVFQMPRSEVAKVPPVVASGGLTLGFTVP